MSHMRTRRTGRVGATIAVAVAFVAVLALASTGIAGGFKDHKGPTQYGPGGDQYKPGSDQYKPGSDQYGGRHGNKLVICHKGRRTIVVSYRSWWAHKKHGATIGRCDRASYKEWKLRKLEKQIAALEAMLARLKEKQAKLAAEG